MFQNIGFTNIYLIYQISLYFTFFYIYDEIGFKSEFVKQGNLHDFYTKKGKMYFL